MRFYHKKWAFSALLLSFFSFQSFAFNFKDFTPQSFEFLVSVAEKEVLEKQNMPLIAQAFIASQASAASLPTWINQYQKILEEAQNLTKNLTPYKKADKVLQFLHSRVLKNYKNKESLITTAFDKGFFNCVSSSFLYNLVLSDLGFQTRGVLVPRHVFSQVKIGEQWIDVETTTAFGFDAGKRKEATNQFKKLTGTVFVPSSKRRGSNITLIETEHYLSLVYSNLGSLHLEQKKYHQGLSYYLKALILYPNYKEAHHNFQAGYTQYALFLIQQNQFMQAEKVILESLVVYPNFKTSLNNLKSLYNNWVQWAIKNGEYSQALQVLEGKKGVFTLEQQENFYAMYIESLFYQGKQPEKALQEGLRLHLAMPQAQKFKKNLIFLFSAHFDSLRKAQKNEEILRWLEDFTMLSDEDFLTFQGHELIKENQTQQGFEILWQIYQKKPSNAMIQSFTQICYLEVQNKKNLKSAQAIALKLAPLLKDNPLIQNFFANYFLLVANFALKNNQIQQSIDVLLAFSAYPDLIAQVDETIGNISYQGIIYPLLNQRKLKLALLEFEKAFGFVSVPSKLLAENYKSALINYGALCYQEKKYQQAYQIYVKLLTLYPKDPHGLKNFKPISEAYLRTIQNSKLRKKVQKEIQILTNK